MNKLEFKQLTNDLFTALNQPAPNSELLREWYKPLEHTELKRLETAYDALIDLQAMPTLENVLMRVQPPLKTIVEPIEEILDIKYPLSEHDPHKNWARKILNNPKNREAIAIKNAKIALHIKI